VLDVVPAAATAANLAAFRKGLADLGYVEGQNVVLNVDVIVTRGTPAALAAKHATGTIPIVMASSGDPLVTGIAGSLASPGGNVTGLSAFATETQGKQLGVLREMVPQFVRIAFLWPALRGLADGPCRRVSSRCMSIDNLLRRRHVCHHGGEAPRVVEHSHRLRGDDHPADPAAGGRAAVSRRPLATPAGLERVPG
jgi:hypothetical protein